MESRVTQFGLKLGLLPGLDPPTTQLPALSTLMVFIDPEAGIKQEEGQEFVARSSAEYLPSMLKILSEPTVSSATVQDALRIALFISMKPISHHDRRFVREHGDQAFAYFLALLRIIYELPSELFQNKGEDETAGYILRTLSNELHARFDDLIAAYPGSSFPVSPIMDEQQQSALHRLAQAIEFNPTLELDEDEKRRLTELLEALPKLTTLDLDSTRENRSIRLLGIWDSCEWLRAEWERKEDVRCVELKDGAELQACSRCLTVRYCSQKHQKLHWKQHKHECFKSSW